MRAAGFAPRMAGDPFAEVRRTAEIMRGFPRPWFVAGGWAVDLFLRRVTRKHEDVEVAIFREDQGEITRHLAGWSFVKIVHGAREPWRGEPLEPSVHELHGVGPDGPLEILVDEASGDLWRFRRNPVVTRPRAAIGLRSSEGMPFLAPEIVLLYKAKEPRPRDEQDFAATMPVLAAEPRSWLRSALAVCHPGHPWIARTSTH